MNETKTKTVIETWPVREYEAVKVWRETKKRQWFGTSSGPNGEVCATAVLDDLGFDSLNAGRSKCPECEFSSCCGLHMVVHWNDGHEFTFKEIADLAEAYPHLVFTEAQS